MCGAYNLLRIKEGDKHLKAFRTKYGIYEYLVMKFASTNSPTSFQNLVNDIFSDLLDFDFVVYLDDTIVFSSSEEENVTHLSTVLSRLSSNSRFSKASKCLFNASSVEYLGYAVFSEVPRCTNQKSSMFLIGLLQETSNNFNNSLPFTTLSVFRMISIQSFHSPTSPRNIQLSPSMRNLLDSFTITSILLYQP
ncbi:hypothetical protein O181_013960 [Austropuccinia psidii MF-1]|uniref:Reverse transcriptase domain-containing protein n=1 Tax=Austropuccinia psidii MF-1 TaxID=1389203 RepID=A0A9Q3C026_9BASI|nr:hypothetical protein [Austropuccinia psidii MF-1]